MSRRTNKMKQDEEMRQRLKGKYQTAKSEFISNGKDEVARKPDDKDPRIDPDLEDLANAVVAKDRERQLEVVRRRYKTATMERLSMYLGKYRERDKRYERLVRLKDPFSNNLCAQDLVLYIRKRMYEDGPNAIGDSERKSLELMAKLLGFTGGGGGIVINNNNAQNNAIVSKDVKEAEQHYERLVSLINEDSNQERIEHGDNDRNLLVRGRAVSNHSVENLPLDRDDAGVLRKP